MVFDVPVLVLCSKMGRIGCCNVESSLIVFKRMTDEGYTVAGDSEGRPKSSEIFSSSGLTYLVLRL